jgi:hypothetical protein
MSDYQLAQLNVATLRASLDSPEMAEFVDNLDRINELAESSPGFVWRLQDEEGNATALRPFGEDLLVNISVWENVESLQGFVFRSAHSDFLKRRKEWFDRMEDSYMVLWWVPAGHQPSEQEAGEKLEQLRLHGPSAQAFSFRERFDAPQ